MRSVDHKLGSRYFSAHPKVDSIGNVGRGTALQAVEVLAMLVRFNVNIALATYARFENDHLILLD